ncbi:MAG TPA: hypothetical protein VEU11_05770 [Terriglobales bacterium]|nr:hypothetical protein [Terriglobales bacterium]
MVEFFSKAEYLDREIATGRFYKRPGEWCAWCDYLPVCTRDTPKISETLVQIR